VRRNAATLGLPTAPVRLMNPVASHGGLGPHSYAVLSIHGVSALEKWPPNTRISRLLRTWPTPDLAVGLSGTVRATCKLLVYPTNDCTATDPRQCRWPVSPIDADLPRDR
jgi:hypothetical protein